MRGAPADPTERQREDRGTPKAKESSYGFSRRETKKRERTGQSGWKAKVVRYMGLEKLRGVDQWKLRD